MSCALPFVVSMSVVGTSRNGSSIFWMFMQGGLMQFGHDEARIAEPSVRESDRHGFMSELLLTDGFAAAGRGVFWLLEWRART
jgi:hypothetical protein